MSPNNETKTAILVIHGVGPHERYQACDDFARGFLDAFSKKKRKEPDVKLKHLLKPRKERVQSCISLYTPGKKECIDCYEYYWDIHMVHKVLPGEAWDLLVKASKNAQDYYKNLFKDPEFIAKVTDLDEFLKSPFFRKKKRKKKDESDVEFRPDGYLRLIGGGTIFIVKILPFIPWFVKLLQLLESLNIPVVSQVYGVLSRLFKALAGTFKNQLEKNFMGDLVRYLDMDPRSKHYETRQKIINGAVEELCALMDDEYQQIIIAGHSLGSVIAYDALNRIILQINAGKIEESKAKKITGLVTFGSPLDKIAFFFREYVSSEKTIQRKILADMHTFRTCSLLKGAKDIEDPDPFFVFPEVRWLNFYHTQDLISGKLDLYELENQRLRGAGSKDGNILIDLEVSKLAAHNSYWGEHQGKDKGTNQMYETIIEEFLE